MQKLFSSIKNILCRILLLFKKPEPEKTRKYPDWIIINHSNDSNAHKVRGFNPRKVILDYFEQEAKNFQYAPFYEGRVYFDPIGLVPYCMREFNNYDLKLLGKFTMYQFLLRSEQQFFKKMNPRVICYWSIVIEKIVKPYVYRFNYKEDVIEALQEFVKYTRLYKSVGFRKFPSLNLIIYPEMVSLTKWKESSELVYEPNEKYRIFLIKKETYARYCEAAEFFKKYRGYKKVSDEDYEKYAVKDWDK